MKCAVIEKEVKKESVRFCFLDDSSFLVMEVVRVVEGGGKLVRVVMEVVKVG
jgi:hypothetical protein